MVVYLTTAAAAVFLPPRPNISDRKPPEKEKKKQTLSPQSGD